jgi:hypothetical protein
VPRPRKQAFFAYFFTDALAAIPPTTLFFLKKSRNFDKLLVLLCLGMLPPGRLDSRVFLESFSFRNVLLYPPETPAEQQTH